MFKSNCKAGGSLHVSFFFLGEKTLLRQERECFSLSQSMNGEGNGTPLQYSCLENPMDGGAWWATVYAVAESDKTKQVTHTKHERESVSCSAMPNSLRPHGLQPTTLFCPQNFPGKNTGVGSHFLLQRIFLTQGSNPGLLK